MTPSFSPSPQQQLWIERWQRFSAAVVRYFHIYAGWLVGISWKRFVLLSLALLIGVNVLKNLPPFTWRISEQVEDPRDYQVLEAQPDVLEDLAGARPPLGAGQAPHLQAELDVGRHRLPGGP